MGIPWDGTGVNCYGMGMGQINKHVPWTTLLIPAYLGEGNETARSPRGCYWKAKQQVVVMDIICDTDVKQFCLILIANFAHSCCRVKSAGVVKRFWDYAVYMRPTGKQGCGIAMSRRFLGGVWFLRALGVADVLFYPSPEIQLNHFLHDTLS